MGKIEWTTEETIKIGDLAISCSETLRDQDNHTCGIRRENDFKLLIKKVVWPVFNLRQNLLIDGFIERIIGSWLQQIIKEHMTIIDVGCGNLKLSKYVRPFCFYNGFDISLSQFQLQRLNKKNNYNLALASATNIPVPTDSCDMILATEVFEHIPDIDRAITEISRIAKPSAKLLCSIPNNYCHKYKKKGPHAEHVNNWGYQEFIDYMELHNYRLVRGIMTGYWIPLPVWLTKTSYQLPIASKDEYYNTNFLYEFQIEK